MKAIWYNGKVYAGAEALQEAFLAEHENALWDLLTFLRDTEYYEIAEFYTAIAHMRHLVPNGQTSIQNMDIGVGMMWSYAMLGNPYAQRWFDVMEE